MRRQSIVPALVATFIAVCWLNQGASVSRTAALRGELTAEGGGRLFDRARYALLFLYRRSADEEIYFALGRALRGLPYDRARLLERGNTNLGRGPEADGHWHAPYTEVPSEYPSAMLPFVLVPNFVSPTFEAFVHVFGSVMGICLIVAAALAIRAQPARSHAERWWSFSLLLLAQGGLAVERLDAVVAVLLALALWAGCHRRPTTAGAAIGLATAAKLIPVLFIVPLVASDLAAWRSRRARALGVLGVASALTIASVPMLIPPTGLFAVLQYHGSRGLQVESTCGVLLAAWRALTGTASPATISYGSFNLDGNVATLFARLAMPLTLASFAALGTCLVRGHAPAEDVARRDRVALALLSAVALLWLVSKVFSPQYLTWGLPLVLAVSGSRGRVLTWLLGAATLVTQIYFRGYYDYVTDLRPLGVATLLVRLVLLIAFFVVATRGWMGRGGSPKPSATPDEENAGIAYLRARPG